MNLNRVAVVALLAYSPLVSLGQEKAKPAAPPPPKRVIVEDDDLVIDDAVAIGDALDIGRANMADIVLQTYMMKWQNESKRLVKMFDIEADVATKLDKDVVPFIKKLADAEAKRQKTINTGGAMMGVLGIDPVLGKAIRPALVGKLTAKQIEQYESDMEVRREFAEELSVLTVLVSVQDSVGVYGDQLTKIETLLRKRVDPSWLNAVQGFGVPQLDKETSEGIAKVLTAKQNAAWEQAMKPPTAAMMFAVPNDGADFDKQRKADFRKGLQISVDARIESLDLFLELDTSQIRKLEILAQGIQVEVCQKRAEAEQQMQNLQFGANQVPDVSMLEYVSATPGALFVNHDRWKDFLAKVLDEGQKTKLTAVRNKRGEQGKLQMAGTVSIGMGFQFGLTGKQTRDFAIYLQGRLPELPAGVRFSSEFINAIVNIPPEDVEPIIGAENMAMWNEQMQQAKQMVEQREGLVAP